ncbi:ABC transporter ATP-binding protein [Pseudarthrobacter sp. Y6]|uniref:ABC transporter ATP-binding protein n=1 Tax=Pseudarthrobacter sp. Y6 TaxID=3418422 RepID=UPI003CE6E292
MNESRSALTVKGLRVGYETSRGTITAVDGIDFHVDKGELLALVGESGCGKTTTAMALLRLLQEPGKVLGGEADLDGMDLLSLSGEELRAARWTRIAFIPQGAQNSLSPLLRVEAQIRDVMTSHSATRISKKASHERVEELLESVGLPQRAARMYPHELSGGMKQRVCIAMAIALNPQLIIADEPTSALDVIVQRVVAQTLTRIKETMQISIIMIGHDLGLLAQLADRVAIMYAGKIVETGPVAQVFADPRHPYTRELMASVPTLGELSQTDTRERGMPDQRNLPVGCIYQGQCRFVTDKCRHETPPERTAPDGQRWSCHYERLAALPTEGLEVQHSE